MSIKHEPWKPDTDLKCTFEIDKRTETVIEITNLDHSQTFAYAVPGFERLIAATPDLLSALERAIEALDAGQMSDMATYLDFDGRLALTKARP